MAVKLEVELLSKAEIEEIWRSARTAARAENFAEYLAFMNQRQIGDSFRLSPEKGANNASSAREIKHNFTEAAKERTANGAPAPVVLRWKTVSHVENHLDKKTGQTTETVVIDKLTALLVSTDSIKPRKKKTAQTAEAPSENGTTTDTPATTEAVTAAA